MKRYLILLAALALSAAAYSQDWETDGLDCTSMAVGRLASDDGSVIT